MPTFLQLSPEHGGQRFGPFVGQIQLGTDPGRCSLALAALPGIAPVHATIAEQGEGQYVVAPVERGFGLFLARPGQPPQAVTGTVSARAGDSIIVGTPQGPRFVLQHERGKGPSQIRQAGWTAAGGGMAGALASEAQRQLFARLLYRTPFGRYTSTLYRLRSGHFLSNPRFLISAVLGVVVVVGGAIVSCVGAVTAWVAAH